MNNLKISENKKSIISLRFNTICEKLNLEYWNLNSTYGGIYIGSFGRQTTNIWVNDIELAFEMPVALKAKYEKNSKTPQFDFLNDVKDTIAQIYPNAKIEEGEKTIQIAFSDKMRFYLLPVFRNYNEYTCANPNSDGSWDTVDPISEIRTMNLGNHITDNNLERLCKMAHCWRRQCEVPIKEKLLDTLVYNFLISWDKKCCSYSEYDVMCKEFFGYLKEQWTLDMTWKSIGSGERIENVENFSYKATIAYFNAKQAIKLEKNKKHWKARQKWGGIFGSKFPESIVLEKQLKKLFDKTATLYKTQIRCVNILNKRSNKTIFFQIVLAVLMILSLLSVGYSNGTNFGIFSFMALALMFLFSIYIQKFSLIKIKEKHKQSAKQLLGLQKQYKMLLDDLNHNDIDVSVILERKSKLQNAFMNVYKGTSAFMDEKYLEAIDLLNKTTEMRSIRSSRKSNVPVWSGTKFNMENHVTNLFHFKN